MSGYKVGDMVQIVSPLEEKHCIFGTNSNMRKKAGMTAIIEEIEDNAFYLSFNGERDCWTWSEGCFCIPEDEATPDMEFSTEDFLNIIKGV